MRIDQFAPYNYTPQTAPQRYTSPEEPQRAGGFYVPGIIVDISPQAREALSRDMAQAEGIGKISEAKGLEGCQTCKSRKYVDRSDDPSVSFQSPAHISPGQAASVVMSHEREHVSNEQAKAERNDRKVISQTVTLSMSSCPECGRMYVSGGVTRTLTAKDNSEATPAQKPNQPAGE